MAHSDKSKFPRHHPGHPLMKKNYNRKMRRLTTEALRNESEPPKLLADFKAPGFCCGGHRSDWRY